MKRNETDTSGHNKAGMAKRMPLPKTQFPPFMSASKNPTKKGSGVSKGFTLTEILIVIVIIAALAAVLFPLLGRVRGSFQATQALDRIRQCGNVLLQSASDNHNKIVIHVKGTSDNMQDLRLHGMMEEITGKESVGRYVYTPAYEKQAKGTWPVWGANVDNDAENGIVWERVWYNRGGVPRYATSLNLARCGSSASYPLLADSSSSAGDPRTLFGNDNQYKFAMRYRGKGPMFMLDGSTRLIGQGEMGKFGVSRAYIFPDNPVSNPKLVSVIDQ